MLERIGVIAWKEIVDNLRDRRSVSNALFSVLLNPLLYIFLFGFMNQSFNERAEQALPLPVIGQAYAPNLVAFLQQNNIEVLEAPTDAETAVRAGEVDVVLVIPEEYPTQFAQGQPALVQLLADESNQGGQQSTQRVRAILEQYSRQVSALRLLARGVSPAILTAVPVQEVDVSPDTRGGAGFILNILPTVMLTAAFFGGFYLAVDMTAGERERDSLEPLLMNPLSRATFVIGKYVAGLSFTILATALATTVFPLMLRLPQVQEFTGIQVSLSATTIITALLIIIPVAFMAVAVEMLIASYARSFKEAQNYVQLIALAGFLPSVFLSVLPIKAQAWMNFIPTVAQQFMINRVTRGEAVNPGEVVIATAVTLTIAVVALVAAVRLYNQERIVLGN